MDWPALVIQWLHIFLGTFWFGAVLFADFILLPAILSLPADRQPPVIRAVSERGDRMLPWIAGLTIVLGIVRGTVVGEIKDVADLGSAYGIFWVVGLVAALATYAWGYYGAERRKAFGRDSAQWVGQGDMPAALVAQRDRIRIMTLVELAGFLVIFTTMILMHFAGEA
jgi:uncharacterized membrane protein